MKLSKMIVFVMIFAALGASASVPEEARRAFIKGAAVAKEAKTPAQQKIAVESFRQAVELAPGWSDALYNLAVAQELAGQYIDARATLKRYIETAPGEEEAREAQDKIYALEGKEAIAVSAGADEAAKKEETKQDLEGAVFVHEMTTTDSGGNRVILRRYTIEIRGGWVSLQRWSNPHWLPQGGYEAVIGGMLDGLACDLPISGGPIARTAFVIEPDARSANLIYFLASGQEFQRELFSRQ